MSTHQVDLLVVGGGINGVGIARDAAGRGLSVLLCEKDDLAQGTSSRSGKLVHGGLRYLEYYEFRLVREALIEREVLLRAAPHIIWPLRFVLPHSREQRPAWMIRLGLMLYDHLGGRKLLPKSRRLDLSSELAGRALKAEFRTGFEYSDCWVDDARLVVLNALDAAARRAQILTRTALVSARREGGIWRAELRDQAGVVTSVSARAIVNAAGPWVEDVLRRNAGLNAGHRVRLVKGSHIVVPKFWDGPHAYLFQNDDRRVIFVNPYQDDLCLIGTTDIPYCGEADRVGAGEDEISYLLRAVNRYCVRQLTRADVVHSFSGVRPLFDDNAENPSAVTRDYVFELNGADGAAPILSVFGGKITTFRKLSEHALERLKPYFPSMAGPWTAGSALPGGDIVSAEFDAFAAGLGRDYPDLPRDVLNHYARLYGTRVHRLLDGVRTRSDLGRHFGGAFYQREAEFLQIEEWALTPEDILERRTKHGLHLTIGQKQAFSGWMFARVKSA
ncbi:MULTISPECIES: glycerol-3-phosphate dehydrogenase [unclassified Bradyrhizobium]|uniref:glycerol-3-phosphate dehydrogenase n=1 Tax=unclassified Bradyrhizobium TaxID=2631580 RepID=UPI001FF734BE|nr:MULTISPECIES: glycerol-3-phosphate dehydrogenase [unclassified Bradyrhizobium]MCK1715435.1 glycerol-3-phosphate dehydrogenase [Bradyrhizobium sp. 143]MCK1728295.1 glycerol-3-phosphate dehydrogenase [Bradyrhizobium sp. 142]